MMNTASGLGADPRLQLFLRLVKAAPLILWAIDKHGRFTMAEGKGLDALGAQPGGWIGRDALEDWKGTAGEDALRRALAGEEFRLDLVLPGPRHYDAWFLPIRDEAGQQNGVFGLALDVTAERNADAELKARLAIVEAQREKIELVTRAINAAPLTLWMLAPDGQVLLSEGGVLAKLGLRPGESVGLNAIEMYRGTPMEEAIHQTLSGQASKTSMEVGPGLFLDTWCVPVPGGSSDEPAGMLGISIDSTERSQRERELNEKLDVIERQAATIRALATPIITIWDEVLCLPVIGTVDSQRTAEMMSALLEAIQREQARYAIVDLTGVEVVDTSTADHLIRLFKAARILGVEGVLCGIRPAVAQTVVALGMDLAEVRTSRTLQDALRWCLAHRTAHKVPTARSSAQPRLE